MLFKRREEHDRAYLRLPGTIIFLPSCKTQLISCQKRGQSYSIEVVRKIKRSYNRIFHNHEFLTERPHNPSRELMPCTCGDPHTRYLLEKPKWHSATDFPRES